MWKVILPVICFIMLILPPVWGDDRAVAVEGVHVSLPDTKGNWAIILGANEFDDEHVSPLSYAVADAESIFAELTQPGGLVPPTQAYLHTTGGKLKPTRKEILRSIDYAVKSSNEDSLVIIFFSSHGFLDDKGRAYVMPEDGDTGLLVDTALPIERILELLSPENCHANKRLLVVDACRSAPRKGERGGGEEVSSQFAEQLSKAEGLVTMLSCSPGEVSYEAGELGHGAFTHFFLEGLRGGGGRNNEGYVTFPLLADYVATQLAGWCIQNR